MKRKWVNKIGKLQEPQTRKIPRKLLVQVKSTAQMTQRFLTKVNITNISGSKHGRFTYDHVIELLSEKNPQDHE